MSTNEERIATLEANEKNIFHQLDNHQKSIDDLTRLTLAIEKIATKTDSINEKVNQIDDRLNQVESQPIKRMYKYKELIITAILSVLAGLAVGILTTIILK